MSIHRMIHAVVGGAGAIELVWFVVLWMRVLRGPGDDNAIALAFIVAAASATVPAFGLVRLRSGRRVGWLWLVCSVPIAIVLAVFGIVFLPR